jgi:uncharacterized iron-regulated membrane protein
MKSFVRTYLLPIHRLIGLTVGLVIMLTAITGVSILFRPQIEPLIDEKLLTVAKCSMIGPLDIFINKAKIAHPEATVDYIRINKKNDEAERSPAIAVRYTNQNFIYFDPCTADVLGYRHRYGGVMGTIEQIHRWRYIDSNGGYISWGPYVTGGSAIIFGFFILILGPVLALLLLAKDKNPFIPKKGLSGVTKKLDIHKTLGLYVAPILMIMILTGLPQAFDWYRSGIYTITNSKPVTSPHITNSTNVNPEVSIQSLWEVMEKNEPSIKEALIHYTVKSGDAIDAYFIKESAQHEHARSMIYFEPKTGRIVKYIPYEESSLGFKLYFWTLALHTGKVNPFFKLIQLVAILSVLYLGYLGISAYFNRKLRENTNANQ